MVLVVYHFEKGDTMADRGEIRVVKWAGLVETLQSFPVIVFAYTCHQNVREMPAENAVLTFLDVFNLE